MAKGSSEGAEGRQAGDCHRSVTSRAGDCVEGQLVFYSVRMAHSRGRFGLTPAGQSFLVSPGGSVVDAGGLRTSASCKGNRARQTEVNHGIIECVLGD
jgi:hypothetical protein